MKKSFTLIELLVVIAIIGILVAMVSYGYSQAKARARDARRKADIDTIKKALELYYQENQRYPITIPIPDASRTYGESPQWWDYSYIDQDGDNIPFLDELAEKGYLSSDIADPKNNSTYHYRYVKYEQGIWTGGCNRTFYILQAVKFEMPQTDHGRGICPSADWVNGSNPAMSAPDGYTIQVFE